MRDAAAQVFARDRVCHQLNMAGAICIAGLANEDPLPPDTDRPVVRAIVRHPFTVQADASRGRYFRHSNGVDMPVTGSVCQRG